jgi:hypothetical protein
MPKEYSWTRLFWYYTGYYEDYPTDTPKEEDVLKKQVLMKQVGLSKLKMNKVRIEPKVPFDLQKIKDEDIKPPKLKRETKEDYDTITPASSPINISQKQKHHKVSYSDKLKLLKNI